MSYIIIAFEHPKNEHSIVYKKCEKLDTLFDAILESEKRGANLWSIRKVGV